MELKHTSAWMESDDYIKSFLAEYHQTKILYEKLHRMCVKYEAGTLDFDTECLIDLLKDQEKYMWLYMNRLKVRAEIEGIDLYDFDRWRVKR